MKKKIIAAGMAITLLFVVFAMNISAAYIIVYEETGYLSDDLPFAIVLRDNTTTHKYTMSGAAGGPYTGHKARIQCTVCYTDNTYDQEYMNPNYYNANVDVYYDTNKTVSYVDMELHIYYGSTYIDTISRVYYP